MHLSSKRLCLQQCIILATFCNICHAWRLIHDQTPNPSSPSQPAIRYAHGSVVHRGMMIVTHGYYYDHEKKEAVWLSDTWAMDLSPPHNWTLLHHNRDQEAPTNSEPSGQTSQTLKTVQISQTLAMPSGRMSFSLVAHQDNIWMFGGDDGGARHHGKDSYEAKQEFDELWRFSLVDFQWHAVPQPDPSTPAPGPRQLHTAIVVGNQMYLYGGRHGKQTLGDLWVYNLDTGTWTLLFNSTGEAYGPCPRYGHGMYALTHYTGAPILVVYAGAVPAPHAGKHNLTGDMWMYNVETEAWQEVTAATEQPSPRMLFGTSGLAGGHHTGRHLNGFGVIAGGSTTLPAQSCSKEVWGFTMDCRRATVMWWRLKDLPYGSHDLTISGVAGRLVLFGGHLCTESRGGLPFWYTNYVYVLRPALRVARISGLRSGCSVRYEVENVPLLKRVQSWLQDSV